VKCRPMSLQLAWVDGRKVNISQMPMGRKVKHQSNSAMGTQSICCPVVLPWVWGWGEGYASDEAVYDCMWEK
jgi:hypothetical protein